ncbi:DEKNAAC103526 [Brettanomyces naardenensis]|uniref:DEKNAAC103526 n=1 Tax=Brettanomyces naardenensis TaxID=13370 RepID=A0A448YNX3_BRENA|nr:DEKNAAC103526 [Brettanomyces naardenensis]
MAPKSISALNLASKCFARASSPLFNANNGSAAIVAAKSFTSYSKPKQTYYEMYNQPSQYDTLADAPKTYGDVKVSNNGAGSVVSGEMTYINNAEDDTFSIPDTPFVPSVSSDDFVSGQGHRTL